MNELKDKPHNAADKPTGGAVSAGRALNAVAKRRAA